MSSSITSHADHEDLGAGKWDRLRGLFEQARHLPPDEQQAFVARQDDLEIREELAKLLGALGSSDDFLETPYRASSADPDKPLRFGRYVAQRKLGQGGMGSVWLARRDDGEFDHTVAVKVIRGGGSPDLVRRFRRERQALASLNHPNITRLLDGGATENGDPYLVMDYVDGEAIDAYAERHGLALHQRLELMVQLCRALEYAHQRRFLHCDIKPSNVLVDARGHVYLLDFGLARYLEQIPDPETRTQTILRAATPDYASPESLTGREVTESSDVYSVGVVLFQLIAGRRPYQLDAHALQDLNRYFESSPPPRLPESTSRELQLMVHRALHTDPRRRYRSVAALREDIERILSGRAVLARPDSVFYRVTRWAHAQPRASIGASAALFLLAILLAVLSLNPVARLTVLSYLTPHPTYKVALAPIENLSSSAKTPWLTSHFAAEFATELEAGEVLKVDKAAESWGQDAGGALAPESLARLRSSGAAALLGGAYELADSNPLSTLRLKLWLVDARSGDTTHITFSSSLAEADALVARACRTLSEQKSGESYPARARHGARRQESEEWTRRGLAMLRRFDLMGARTAFERAVNRNAANVPARAALAQTMESLGYNDDAHDQIVAASSLGGYAGSDARKETAAVAAELEEDWAKAEAIRRAQLAAQPGVNERGLALGQDLLGARQLDELGSLIQKETPRAPDVWTHFAWIMLKAEKVRWTAGRPAGGAAVKELEKAADALDSTILKAQALETASELYAGIGKRPLSITKLWDSRALFAKAGHREGVARVTGMLAQRYHNTHRQLEAIQMASASLADIEGAGFSETEQLLRFHLGTAYQAMHYPQTARAYYTHVLAQATRPFGRFETKRLLERLGLVLADVGETAEGIQRLEASLQPHTHPDAVRHLRYLADVELDAGQLAKAEKRLQEIESLMPKDNRGAANWTAVRSLQLGVLHGDVTGLDSGFQTVVDHPRAGEEPPAVAQMFWGRAFMTMGRPADAAAHFREALRGFEAYGEDFYIMSARLCLAGALARANHAAEARLVLAQAAPAAEQTQCAEQRVDLDLAKAYIQLSGGVSDEGLNQLAVVASECRKFGYLPRALDTEIQLARLRHDTATEARLNKEASAAAIKLY